MFNVALLLYVQHLLCVFSFELSCLFFLGYSDLFSILLLCMTFIIITPIFFYFDNVLFLYPKGKWHLHSNYCLHWQIIYRILHRSHRYAVLCHHNSSSIGLQILVWDQDTVHSGCRDKRTGHDHCLRGLLIDLLQGFRWGVDHRVWTCLPGRQ